MAANPHLSAAGCVLALNALLTQLNGGTVIIYSGMQPASCDVAVGVQVALATLTLSATAFPTAVSGGVGATATANTITAASANAVAGTAAWFRAFKSDATTAVIDGSVGTSAADLIISSTTIGTNDTVTCTSWVVSMAK